MPRLRSQSLPSKPVHEHDRPLADYFPVSRKQLSEFLAAWTKKEKERESQDFEKRTKGKVE